MMTHALNDGHELPAIGFGTYPLRGEDGITAMVSAIEVGYRLLDTAVNYENEREVGEAIRRSGVPREELVVCSKLPGRHHGYDDAIASARGSLERLGLDRLDLHLIHWPNPSRGSTSRPGGRWSTCGARGWSPASVSRTSRLRTCVGSSTRPA